MTMCGGRTKGTRESFFLGRKRKRKKELIRENPRRSVVNNLWSTEVWRSLFRDAWSHNCPSLTLTSDRDCLIVRRAKGFVLLCAVQIVCRARCFYESREAAMNILNHIKITPRDAQVLKLLVQGCSNKKIARLSISPHRETTSAHAILADRHPGWPQAVKVATAMFQKEQMESCLRATGEPGRTSQYWCGKDSPTAKSLVPSTPPSKW
jgi:hypothetical protein